MAVIDWLLDSDPAIRWQVLRDLAGAPDAVVSAERARVSSEGWGAHLLGLQAPDGQWGGIAFSHDWTTPRSRGSRACSRTSRHAARRAR